MNEPNPSHHASESAGDPRVSNVFAHLVLQQTNMALMFLGQVPHPESGQPIRDLDAAKSFIDQLEMLEAKTKGNLDKREQTLLKQNLTALRMAFVEAVNEESAPAAKSQSAAPSGRTAAEEPKPATEPQPEAAEAESRKKFSKKY